VTARRRLVGLSLAAIALVATGCTSVLGVTDPPSNTCGGATATTQCGLCLSASCCSQLEACAGDSDCVDGLLSCAEGCSGDTSCLDQCAAPYSSTTISEYNDLISCTNSSCPSSCGS
jgi:hypothetical protein